MYEKQNLRACFFSSIFLSLSLSAGSISITVLFQHHRTTTEQIFTFMWNIFHKRIARISPTPPLPFPLLLVDFLIFLLCCRSMSVCHEMEKMLKSIFSFWIFIDAAYLFYWHSAISDKSPRERERIRQNCNQIVCNWSLIGLTFEANVIDWYMYSIRNKGWGDR